MTWKTVLTPTGINWIMSPAKKHGLARACCVSSGLKQPNGTQFKKSSADAWGHINKGFSVAYKALYDAWEKSEKEVGFYK